MYNVYDIYNIIQLKNYSYTRKLNQVQFRLFYCSIKLVYTKIYMLNINHKINHYIQKMILIEDYLLTYIAIAVQPIKL